MNSNITWHNNKVTYEEKCKLLGQKGMVVWFTGLSGSGKSTIAVEIEKRLFGQGFASCMLDGDNMRTGLNSDLGFSSEDRIENIRRATEVAKLIANTGMITLVSFITPFHSMREAARKCIGEQSFLEVYVKADFETCMQRDPKGLYKKNIENFTGKSSPYEVPQNPDIILDTEHNTLEECVDNLLEVIVEKCKI